MTYTTINGRVVRTAFSMDRAALRAVWRTPDRQFKTTAQDVADEKKLSRSRQYTDKGANESARRVRQEANRMERLESRHLAACADFDAMKSSQEEAA